MEMQTIAQISTKHPGAYFNVKHTLKYAPKHAAASLKVFQDYKTRDCVFYRLSTWSKFLCELSETRKISMLQKTARRQYNR